jgi:hypothetical protein
MSALRAAAREDIQLTLRTRCRGALDDRLAIWKMNERDAGQASGSA